jgi:hypothetical protein
MKLHTKLILHPTDFSDNAAKALKFSLEFLDIPTTRLLIMHVIEVPPGGKSLQGKDAIETANSFRLTARQVLPKDMAEFLTMKFVSSTTADQIAVSKALDYAIIERYGITGIPEGKKISSKLLKALKGVFFIMVAFIIYSTIISLISVTLFKSSGPSYFNNAFESFFTIFKIFSGDGFSDVVAEIVSNSSLEFGYFTKLYFVMIVFTGSILGLSLINSVFIDQMSNFDKKGESEINSLENKLDEVLKNQELLFKELNEMKKAKDE